MRPLATMLLPGGVPATMPMCLSLRRGSPSVSTPSRPCPCLNEYTLSSKRMELLKEVVPRVMRVAVIRDPSDPGSIGQFAAIQAVAVPLGVELIPVDVSDASQIEHQSSNSRMGKTAV